MGGPPGSFPSSATFLTKIDSAAVDSESATVMAALQASGWGPTGKKKQIGIDVSFSILSAGSGVTPRPFNQDPGALPDCDTAPIPVPPGGHIESNPDYACADGGDCHLLVYQGQRLYELYQADISGGQATGGTFNGGCLVVWDLTKDYWQPGTPFSRGDGCNGADAADLPMAPLILKKDEIMAGAVNHAMRFTIDNSLIRATYYVHPATHLGGPTGGSNTLPYGARLRLRSSFDLSTLPSDAARTVAKALQTYGMFLADGGNIYISAGDDVADAINPSALSSLQPSDFEMIDGGMRYDFHQQNCTRTPITQ
jgi:serine/threonine-protein kinase